MGGDAGAGQFHFGPAAYLAMLLAEVPAYRDLQRQVAEAARGIEASAIRLPSRAARVPAYRWSRDSAASAALTMEPASRSCTR